MAVAKIIPAAAHAPFGFPRVAEALVVVVLEVEASEGVVLVALVEVALAEAELRGVGSNQLAVGSCSVSSWRAVTLWQPDNFKF